MNKSEIAEKAARKIVQAFPLVHAYGAAWQDHEPGLIKMSKAIVERAIAESQVPQPTKIVNGITYKGPFICKHCGFDIYDNGSVAVHLYQQYDRGGRLVMHESQWCDDDTKEAIAEPKGNENV